MEAQAVQEDQQQEIIMTIHKLVQAEVEVKQEFLHTEVEQRDLDMELQHLYHMKVEAAEAAGTAAKLVETITVEPVAAVVQDTLVV